jgi:hypothetical protein
LRYDPQKVQPAGSADKLPGVELAPGGNRTLHGLRLTDADGKAFDTSRGRLTTTSGFDRASAGRIIMDLRLDLSAAKDGAAAPANLVFWGTYTKPVAVPFSLKDVPLK